MYNDFAYRFNIQERNLKPDYDLEDLNFFRNEFNIHPKDRNLKAGEIID